MKQQSLNYWAGFKQLKNGYHHEKGIMTKFDPVLL